MPSISIVMPTYNYASHIIEQINNVLKQQHTDFELIICDDGSTDDTVDKVAAITDVRVKYHQLSHNNANVARNWGISQAKGEYIAFLDVDDRWFSDHLSQCLSTIQRLGCDGVYSGMNIIRPNGTTRQYKSINPNLNEPFASFILRASVQCQSSGLFMTTSSVRDILWDEQLLQHQDYDFVIRYAAKYSLKPTGLVTYDHGSRLCTKGNVHFESCMAFIERNRVNIAPSVLRFYYNHMLTVAKYRHADQWIVDYYTKQLHLYDTKDNSSLLVQ